MEIRREMQLRQAERESEIPNINGRCGPCISLRRYGTRNFDIFGRPTKNEDSRCEITR